MTHRDRTQSHHRGAKTGVRRARAPGAIWRPWCVTSCLPQWPSPFGAVLLDGHLRAQGQQPDLRAAAPVVAEPGTVG